jgi:glycosyltransferase involved in cell wall biosynthesis
MKIAYIVDVQCNHGHKWIRFFAKHHEVIIVCKEGQQSFPLYEKDNIQVYPILPNAYPLRNRKLLQQTLKELEAIFQFHAIDVIHAMYAVPYGFWAYKIGSTPYLITTRGSDMLIDFAITFHGKGNLVEQIRNFLLRKLTIQSLRKATWITSTSKLQQRTILDAGVPKTNMRLIRTGVDASGFLEDLLKSPKLKTETIHVFSNRAMAPLYNIDLIIQAFDILVKQRTDCQFHLTTIDYYGDKEYLVVIQNLIKSLKLQDLITILPSATSEELAAVYSRSDMVVMFPSSDGTPVSGIEAMLSKKPLVAGPLRYDNDLFNEETIWICPAFSANSLAEVMNLILTTEQVRVTEKCELAFERALELADFNKEVQKVDQLYHSIHLDQKNK